MRIRYLLIICGWIGAIGLIFGLFKFGYTGIPGFGIAENKITIIADRQKVNGLIAKNTPLKVEIINQRWGKAIIEDPEILFDIWNMLKEMKTYPSKYLVNQDQINGNIYFYDGSKQTFSISDRFQLGEYFVENIENEQINVKKIYRILQYTLATKKNLIKMITEADDVYLYRAEDYFDPDSDKMLHLNGEHIQKLLSNFDSSRKVGDSHRLNRLLLEGKLLQPIFHIALAFKKSDGVKYIIISILSPEYFNVMDMSFVNRNLIYFEGPLWDFCNEMMVDSHP